MKLPILFLLVLIPGYLASQVLEQNNMETGQVIEAINKAPVEGATIIFFSSKYATVTDEVGRFVIRKVDYLDSFKISIVGFTPKVISYAEFKRSGNFVTLTRQIADLSAVTISRSGGDQFRLISKADINILGIHNSQEVLPIVPGLFIGQHAGGGKAEQIFLRGFDIDHGADINISVDGMPVNMVSHAHGQGYADLHFVIPELIENVQFKKGPYYASKGNLATTGFVDFRSRNTLPKNMVKVEAGMFYTHRFVGMTNLFGKEMQRKNQSAYIAAEYLYSDGYFDHPQDFNRVNLFGKYYGKLNQHNSLQVSVSTFHSKWNASGQIPERAEESGMISFFGAIDPYEGGHTSRSNINAILYTNLKGNNYLKNQVYYTHYNFELYSNFTFFLIDSVNGDQIRQKEKRSLLGYNGSYTNVQYVGNTRFTSELGVSVRYDQTNNSELSRTKDRNILLAPLKLGDINELNASIYIDETVRRSNRFTINAGARLDQFHMNYKDQLDNNRLRQPRSTVFSPKLNLYYYPNDKTEIYLTSGKGFHSNDTRVVVDYIGKESLPAAYGSDLGLVLKPSRNLLLNVAIWYLYLEQEFVYVGDEGVVEPSGRSKRMGLDLSVRYQPARSIFFDLDANYCKGRFIDEPKDANLIPLAPVFTTAGGVTYKSKMGLGGSVRYRYMSHRPANENGSVTAKGYFINDLTMQYVQPRYELGMMVQNLFNVRWKETQFDTESRLKEEPQPVSEIHFTPGTPFFLKLSATLYFSKK